jgi:hypothetical protein
MAKARSFGDLLEFSSSSIVRKATISRSSSRTMGSAAHLALVASDARIGSRAIGVWIPLVFELRWVVAAGSMRSAEKGHAPVLPFGDAAVTSTKD